MISGSRPKQDLTIALIQFDPIWESPRKNFPRIEQAIGSVDVQTTDLIVLPEMCTTGFTMNSVEMGKYSKSSVQFFQDISRRLNISIACSIIFQDQGAHFNRFFAFSPLELPYTYDKRHLFSYAKEDKHYQRGESRGVFKVNGWSIFPFVCYDIRFPVWLRNNKDYDVILGVANFPEIRIDAWTTLLKARAIENLSYSVGVNRIGNDPNVRYNGRSMVYDPLGKELVAMGADDKIKSVTLSYSKLQEIRGELKFQLDADDFEIKH